MRRARIYTIWSGIKDRCLNPKNARFKDYGGRGITICDAWLAFEGFHADMGDGPPGLQIDRIDNDGPYSPENCRWASPKEQSNNTRRNRVLTFRGETRTVSEWEQHLGLPRRMIFNRLKSGWTHERALSTPNLKVGYHPRARQRS